MFGMDRVRIEVIDNGIGIESGNLPRIFSHGFTARNDRRRSGLHSSTNLAGETRGTLTVLSGCTGKGALSTLKLPAVRR